MENIRKHKDIKLVTTNRRRRRRRRRRRSYLVSKTNYHTMKCFSEKLLAIEIKKVKEKMNKPIHFGLSILEISKASV